MLVVAFLRLAQHVLYLLVVLLFICGGWLLLFLLLLVLFAFVLKNPFRRPAVPAADPRKMA